MKHIEIECGDCSGTGVKREKGSPKTLAALCEKCGGSGKDLFYFKPFKGRRKRTGIELVTRWSGAHGALGFGPMSGPTISYAEFLDGKMPPESLHVIQRTDAGSERLKRALSKGYIPKGSRFPA